VTWSSRPDIAHGNGLQKLRKYVTHRSSLGCQYVGLIAVGDNRVWVTVWDKACADMSQADPIFQDRVDLRKRSQDSGAVHRAKYGDKKELEWRQTNAGKCRNYEKEARTRGLSAGGGSLGSYAYAPLAPRPAAPPLPATRHRRTPLPRPIHQAWLATRTPPLPLPS
jgi:hypothetical protein